jgi:hypothetical protein
MPEETPTVTVDVYLPIELRTRKAKTVQLYHCKLEKRVGWDAGDFNPFFIRKTTTTDWGGYIKEWPLEVAKACPEHNAVALKQISFAYSEFYNRGFWTALYELGWNNAGSVDLPEILA